MITRKKVWIQREANALLLAESNARYPLETGGVLLGYRNGTHLVIVACIGPGPGALHHPLGFQPDAEHQQSEIDRLYGLDSLRHVYLGDWHTHPGGAPRLSPRDRRTLKAIAKAPEARVARPVMLLLSGEPEAWGCHVFEYRKLLAPLQITQGLKVYD